MRFHSTTMGQMFSLTKLAVICKVLVTMFPNLQKIASIGLSLPVSTASIERSFSEMKQIKTCLRNSLTEGQLTQLMWIAIEHPDQHTKDEIEVILDIWNRNLEENQFETSLK